MRKVYQEMLAAYKKANQSNKEKMATKFGYKSAADFLAMLNKELGIDTNKKPATKTTSKPTTKAPNKQATKITSPTTVTGKLGVKPTIHNVHILDVSVSMRGDKLSNAVLGINKEIETLKADNNANYTNTLVTFSDYNTKKVWMKPMSDARPITATVTGNTALHDAVGDTLTALKSSIKNGEKVLVKIFTDGEENSSRRWNSSTVAYLIKEVEELGFTIAFIGTQKDVNKVIDDYGIDKSNTLVHHNTAESVLRSFGETIGATTMYSKKVAEGQDVKTGFFKKLVKK